MDIEDLDADAARTLLSAMAAAVYPPEILARVPWREVVSARAERRIVVRDAGQVVSTAGMLWREVSLDGEPVCVGGLGGVMTEPRLQGKGFGGAAVSAAMGALAGRPDAAFGLLFCEEKRVGFYLRLGWRRFDGEVMIEQPAGRLPYRVVQAMVCPLSSAAPTTGLLDLEGPPW